MAEITHARPLQSLDETSREHNARIMAHVDALSELAEMIDNVDMETFSRHFEAECDFINMQLLPHIVAIEATLYRELERLMEHRHSMEPMREEHARLRRLFVSLCQYRQSLRHDEFDRESVIGLRRVLYRLYALLKVHMAEEEMYLRVVDRDLTAEEKDALARSLDHAAAQPV